MLSAVCLFVVLLGAVSVSADGIPLQIGNSNGLMAVLLPDSISVTRHLPGTTMSPPSTPASSPSPPTTTPQSPLTPQANVSSSSMPPGSPPSQPMSTLPPTAAPALTTGMITFAVASIRELDHNFTQVVATPLHNVNGLVGNGVVSHSIMPQYIPGSTPNVQIMCQSINNTLYPDFNTTSLVVNVCGILNNGTVAYGDESSQIAMGQLGLSVQLAGWPWTSAGSFLEFNVKFSVTSGRKLSVTSGSSAAPVMIGLGTTDSYAMLSTKTTNPNFDSFQTMSSGYPMLTQNNPADETAIVTAMFPRSSSQTIVWNVAIEPGYQPSQKQPGPVAAAEGLVASWVIQAVTAALAYWVGSFDRRQ